MFEHDVSIILSTYNGSKFLRHQLDSLVDQSYENYTIWVRDDGSSDSTKAIIEEYKGMYPNKFKLVDWESSQNLGFGASFLRLLELADGELFFFCDQDDIWRKDKLEKITTIYQSSIDKSIPILIHSDLCYMSDGKLNNLSFFTLTKFKSHVKDKLMFRGFIPGCTMAFNDALRVKMLEIGGFFSHDLLATLLANLYGKILIIDDQLIRYRLHVDNTVGIGRASPISFLLKDFFRYLFDSRTYRESVLKDYFFLAKRLRELDGYLLLEEVFDRREVNALNFIDRKIWYYQHFYPFDKSISEGIVKLALI